MDVSSARAQYDTALAQYTEALARLESGEQTPGLSEHVHALYAATLSAHAALLAAAQAPGTPAATPVTPEPITAVPSATGGVIETESASVGNAPAAPAVGGPALPSASGAAASLLPRRSGLARFSPPPANAPAEQPLRRDVLTSERSAKRSEIGTERKLAGSLPEWSPLPPGEILAPVRR